MKTLKGKAKGKRWYKTISPKEVKRNLKILKALKKKITQKTQDKNPMQLNCFEDKIDDEMNYKTFVEDDNEKYPCQLSLWFTKSHKLWIEVGPCDVDDQRMMMQGLVLGLEDARELLEELTGIVRAMETG